MPYSIHSSFIFLSRQMFPFIDEYAIPLVVSRFFLSLCVEEWHKIATYMGFKQEFLTSLVCQHLDESSNEDQVSAHMFSI